MRRGPRLARMILLAALFAGRAAPTWAQSTLELSGSALWTNAVDVEVLGGTAYCPVPEGLLILDIRDLFAPAVRSFAISPDSTVVRAAFHDTTVYLSMGTAGAAVFDGSDPDSARLLARIPVRANSVIGIAGKDSLVFTTEDDSLYTYVLGPDTVATFKSALRLPVVARGLEWAGETLVFFGASGAVTLRIGIGGVPVPVDTLPDTETYVASSGNDSYLYAATQQSREVVVFSAAGGGAYTEEGRLPVVGSVSDLDLTPEFLAAATDSGFGVYLLSDPRNPTLILDHFDGAPTAALGLEGRTLAAVRGANRCEFYTIVLPLDLFNVQNVPGRGTFLHADFSDGHLYVASQDSGAFRYPAPAGPQLGARSSISPDGTRSIAARDTVVVAGLPSVGVVVYSGPVGGTLTPRDSVPPVGSFVDADVRGGLAAVANKGLGVRIMSVADANSPQILSSYRPTNIDAVRAAFVADTLLYVLNASLQQASQPGLHVVDLSNPAVPQQLTVISEALAADLSIDFANHHLALLHGPPGSRGVTLFDISNPASPAPLDTVSVPDGNHLAINGQSLLVTKNGGGFYRVVVSGGSLTVAGEGTTIAPATWTVVGPQAFYVLEGTSGIQVFESSGSTSLLPLGQFEFGGSVVATATLDSTIVVGDNAGVVTTLRLTLAGTIIATDRTDLSAGIRAIAFLSGDSLCAVVTDDSLHLLSISETGDIGRIGSMVSPPGFLINAIAFSGSYLFLGGGQFIFVIDVSNPASPNLVDYFDARGPGDPARHGSMRSIVVSDSTLFALQRGNPALGQTALLTIWRLDPSSTQPHFLGRFKEPNIEYLDAVVRGSLVYIGQGDNGVGVFSVANPSNITKAATVSGLLGVESVTIVGDFLVTANGTSGFAALDLAADPVSPPVVAQVETPVRARAVAALPEIILVADTGALLVYRTEIIIEDVLPPVMALGLIPNPFITAYADLYVVSDEPLAEAPTVHFVIADLDSLLPLSPIGASGTVYQTQLILTRVGSGFFEVGGCDVHSNCTLSSREAVFDSLRGAPGGSVSIDSGGFKASIDPGSFSGEARLLAVRYREQDLPTAGWGSGVPEGGTSSGYQVSILDPMAVPLRLSFQPPGDGPPTSWQAYERRPGGWAPLETRFDGVSLEAVSEGDGLFWLGRGEALDTSGLPREAVLYPNAPNPFNPSTRIRYDVPMPGARVRVGIYSVEGRLVRELASGFEDAGQREKFWDGRDAAGTAVASGIYFLRYEAGPRVLTRKITLLR